MTDRGPLLAALLLVACDAVTLEPITSGAAPPGGRAGSGGGAGDGGGSGGAGFAGGGGSGAGAGVGGNAGAAMSGSGGAAAAGNAGAAMSGSGGATTAGNAGAAMSGSGGAATSGSAGAAMSGSGGAATSGSAGAGGSGTGGSVTAGANGGGGAAGMSAGAGGASGAGAGGAGGAGNGGAGGQSGAGAAGAGPFTVEVFAAGFVIDQGKATETMVVDDQETWRQAGDGTAICVISFATTSFVTAPACPTCEWGFQASLSNGVVKSGDCTSVGYAPGAASKRSPVHYSYERDPLTPPWGGFLWRFAGGAWEKIGGMMVGGDPTTSCDLSWTIAATPQ